MLPRGRGIITEMPGGHEPGRAFGTFGPVRGMALAGAPIDAALFCAGRRMVFAVNLPQEPLTLLGAQEEPARVALRDPDPPGSARGLLPPRPAGVLPTGPRT